MRIEMAQIEQEASEHLARLFSAEQIALFRKCWRNVIRAGEKNGCRPRSMRTFHPALPRTAAHPGLTNSNYLQAVVPVPAPPSRGRNGLPPQAANIFWQEIRS